MLPKNPLSVNPLQWNAIVGALPNAHILQTWEWGKVKSEFGWQPYYLVWFKDDGHIELSTSKHLDDIKHKRIVAAALTLHRKIVVGGFSHRMGVMYVPKGPLLDWSDKDLSQRVLLDLATFAQKHSAIFVKIDPDVEVGTGISGTADSCELESGKQVKEQLLSRGWQYSEEQVQFRNTVLIDLNPTEEQLLANMKQKTRYNINLAIRKGVSVRVGKLTDLDMLYRMYAETSIRDGFIIRNEAYYRSVWTAFLQKPGNISFDQPVAEALIAEVDGGPVAAVIIFCFARKAWYLYGMSTLSHRDKMPNYLLQWEAIKRLKAANCIVYDLWGAPDEFIDTDPLWGVYRFKEGLGGKVHRTLGAWDLPVNRMLYRLYAKTLPGLLDIMRKHGRESTRQTIG